MSPVLALVSNSELDIRHTFQKFIGAVGSSYELNYIWEAAYISALLIYKFIIVTHVAKELLYNVLNVKAFSLVDLSWCLIVTDIWKDFSPTIVSFALYFEKSITPLCVVSYLSE